MIAKEGTFVREREIEREMEILPIDVHSCIHFVGSWYINTLNIRRVSFRRSIFARFPFSSFDAISAESYFLIVTKPVANLIKEATILIDDS